MITTLNLAKIVVLVSLSRMRKDESAVVISRERSARVVEAVHQLNDASLPVRYSAQYYASILDASPTSLLVASIWRADALLAALTARFEYDDDSEVSNDSHGDDNDELWSLSGWLTALAHWWSPPPRRRRPRGPNTPLRLYIMTLAVIPDERRHGLASRLVAAAFDWARATNARCRAATLHVKASNDAALMFYARLGFRQHGPLLSNHYRIGDQRFHGLCLRIPLTAADDSNSIAIDMHASAGVVDAFDDGDNGDEIGLWQWICS